MLTTEQINDLHRLYWSDHWPIRKIERRLAFFRYVSQKFGARHALTIVPLCGHNARCIFAAEPALPILFHRQ